jgi:hypothetical protein
MLQKHHVLGEVLAGSVSEDCPADQAQDVGKEGEGGREGGREKGREGGGKRQSQVPGPAGKEDDSTVVLTDERGEDDEEEDVEQGFSEKTPPSLGDVGRSKAVRALQTRGATFTVRYNFTTEVFAHDRNVRAEWEACLAEEFGAPVERLFLTLFFTATEGRNLIRLYLRNFDPVGLLAVALAYLISLVLATGVVGVFALAAGGGAVLVLLYAGTLRYALWFPWRYLLSPGYHRLQQCWHALRRCQNGRSARRSRQTSSASSASCAHGCPVDLEPPCPHVKTPFVTPVQTWESRRPPDDGGKGRVSWQRGRLALHHRRRRDRHAAPRYFMSLYHRYSPSYLTARIISAFYSQWETIRSSPHRTTTEVLAKHIHLVGVSEAAPEGLLGPLVSFNVPSFVFGIEAVQAVIDYKFRNFGRAVLKTEAAIYATLLMTFSAFLVAVHDPDNPVFFDARVDWSHVSGRGAVRCAFGWGGWCLGKGLGV